MSIADLRLNYTKAGLEEKDAQKNPIDQFKIWFQQALDSELLEPNAMTVSTTTKDGYPSARIVLLKAFDERGFVFFTNYDSKKGQKLTHNPYASLVFWWGELERQIRIEGKVEKVTPQESDQYFYSRPRDSQLGAWVSQQSKIIESRAILDQEFAKLKAQYEDKIIPRPEHWGGFRVIPNLMEFWQGRPNRLHDRLLYRQDHDTWIMERLAP
jgi:pyridoxamine 5'-phosphate oxidase